jgi:mannitol/fructose-specific phosphotransferase system IIA component (Ntr-type)
VNTLDVLLPAIARVNVVARDREDLLRSLVQDLFREGLIAEEREPLEKLLAREAVQSTALGGGIALPHARTVASPVHRFAAARVDPALDYDAPDGIPVALVFLLLGPPEAPV